MALISNVSASSLQWGLEFEQNLRAARKRPAARVERCRARELAREDSDEDAPMMLPGGRPRDADGKVKPESLKRRLRRMLHIARRRIADFSCESLRLELLLKVHSVTTDTHFEASLELPWEATLDVLK